MAMQTDVKSTKPLTSTGVFKTQSNADATFRARVKAIYVTCGETAGSVAIKNGASGANILVTVNTPAVADTGSVYLILPGEGILAENGLYGTVTNAASVTLFYA